MNGRPIFFYYGSEMRAVAEECVAALVKTGRSARAIPRDDVDPMKLYGVTGPLELMRRNRD